MRLAADAAALAIHKSYHTHGSFQNLRCHSGGGSWRFAAVAREFILDGRDAVGARVLNRCAESDRGAEAPPSGGSRNLVSGTAGDSFVRVFLHEVQFRASSESEDSAPEGFEGIASKS